MTILDGCISLNSVQIFWLCWELWIFVDLLFDGKIEKITSEIAGI